MAERVKLQIEETTSVIFFGRVSKACGGGDGVCKDKGFSSAVGYLIVPGEDLILHLRVDSDLP